jgi:hypothetical protein
MRAVLVSSCTNRKKVAAPATLQARTLQSSSLELLAEEWQERCVLAEEKVPVRSLYAGRAFTEALAAADVADGGCYIVSAGLGLVSMEDEVPSYSLTVAGKDENNILSKVEGSHASPAEWWAVLTRSQLKKSPLSDLIENSLDSLVVLALPSSYVELVADDLAALSALAAKRVRVIGLPSLRTFLPETVVDSLVPYDERFEAPESGRAGTRSDFPQRAARHFMESIVTLAASGDAKLHSSLVAKALDGYCRPKRPQRERHTDEMLKEVIHDLWAESQGRVTNALRLLRSKRKIACEQSRFKRLFWEVAAKKDVRK